MFFSPTKRSTFTYFHQFFGYIFTMSITSDSNGRKSRLSVIGRARRGRTRSARREVAPSVAAMTESLALVSGLLKRLGAAGMAGGSVSSTVYAMGEANKKTTRGGGGDGK